MSKKICWLFVCSLLFSLTTCTTVSSFLPWKTASTETGMGTGAGNTSETTFFNSMPAGNALVFIGITGKRSDPKETIQFALEDAARRVAVYQRVYGEYIMLNNIGSGAFDYAYDSRMSLTYDEEGSKQYVDSLQFNADTDAIEMENALIIRTTYPAALPSPVSYRPTYSANDQKPDWVDNPPSEIAGYEVGVGYSGRFSSFADTCTNAFRNAVFAIIRNVNSSFRSSDLLYQNTSSLFGYKTSNDNMTRSYGILNGFYVLDTWVNPKDKSVWTLAIAKKAE